MSDRHTIKENLPAWPHNKSDTVVPPPENRDDKHNRHKMSRRGLLAGLVSTAVLAGGGALGYKAFSDSQAGPEPKPPVGNTGPATPGEIPSAEPSSEETAPTSNETVDYYKGTDRINPKELNGLSDEEFTDKLRIKVEDIKTREDLAMAVARYIDAAENAGSTEERYKPFSELQDGTDVYIRSVRAELGGPTLDAVYDPGRTDEGLQLLKKQSAATENYAKSIDSRDQAIEFGGKSKNEVGEIYNIKTEYAPGSLEDADKAFDLGYDTNHPLSFDLHRVDNMDKTEMLKDLPEGTETTLKKTDEIVHITVQLFLNKREDGDYLKFNHRGTKFSNPE